MLELGQIVQNTELCFCPYHLKHLAAGDSVLLGHDHASWGNQTTAF
jgi:hypothetical protein